MSRCHAFLEKQSRAMTIRHRAERLATFLRQVALESAPARNPRIPARNIPLVPRPDASED